MKITFITTGGTIDKAYEKKKGTYNFEIMNPSVTYVLKNITPNFEHEIISALKKDSLDMDDQDRQLVFDTCKDVENDKIIITHGTDTMIDTAKKLSEIKGKVIVLVGAAQPERFKETDADFNIGMAVGAVNILKEGVYVAMNGRVYEWDKCKKSDSGHFLDK
jgi:L-asparaginase